MLLGSCVNLDPLISEHKDEMRFARDLLKEKLWSKMDQEHLQTMLQVWQPGKGETRKEVLVGKTSNCREFWESLGQASASGNPWAKKKIVRERSPALSRESPVLILLPYFCHWLGAAHRKCGPYELQVESKGVDSRRLSVNCEPMSRFPWREIWAACLSRPPQSYYKTRSSRAQSSSLCG